MWIQLAKVLRLGDEVLAVNGQSLQGLSHEEAVQQLREFSGPAVTLRVRPNQTLEDIFSSESKQHRPEQPAPLSISFTKRLATLPSSSDLLPKEKVSHKTGPLPKGWTEKMDHKTGRPYFENHHTCTATWSDPCTLQPVALEHYEWNVLPPGWERYLDEQGDTYYVNHDTQTTHWDCPHGSRQQRQLQELASFLHAQTEQLDKMERELEGKREQLLEKNALFAALEKTQAQEVGGAEDGEDPSGGISPVDLVDDIMLLNEEVEMLDGHVTMLRRCTRQLSEVHRSTSFEDVDEGAAQRTSAALALQLASCYSRLKSLDWQLRELVASLENQRKQHAFSDTPLQYALQLPPPTERSEVEERRAWLHTLPDRLTGKTNCEMRVELLVLESSCRVAEELQISLTSLQSSTNSGHVHWEGLLDELASYDFSPLHDQWLLKATFRDKLGRVVSVD